MSFEGVEIKKMKGGDQISPPESDKTFYGRIVDGKLQEITPADIAERKARQEIRNAPGEKAERFDQLMQESMPVLPEKPKFDPEGGDLSPEQVQSSAGDYEKSKEAIASAQSIEELFTVLKNIKAEEWTPLIQRLVEKVDQGEPIDPHNDEDLGKITTYGGLLQKVVDLLQIRRQRKALGLDTN